MSTPTRSGIGRKWPAGQTPSMTRPNCWLATPAPAGVDCKPGQMQNIAMVATRFKSCSRCGGDVVERRGADELWAFECLQCGADQPPPAGPRPVATVRTVPEPSPEPAADKRH